MQQCCGLCACMWMWMWMEVAGWVMSYDIRLLIGLCYGYDVRVRVRLGSILPRKKKQKQG